MLTRFHGLHAGATLALIGSGPTALNYQAAEDVAIVLNGAVLIEQPFHYFLGIDHRLPERPYWNITRGETRIIGALIAGADPRLYPGGRHEPVTVARNVIADEWLEAHPPQDPHCFAYHVREFAPPDYAAPLPDWLTHGGNVAHCGLEVAYRMGAAQINMYGIDMGEREYFYSGKLGGTYSGLNGRRLPARFIDMQIRALQGLGVTVTAQKSPGSRLPADILI